MAASARRRRPGTPWRSPAELRAERGGEPEFGDTQPDELAARRARRSDPDIAGMRARDRAYRAAYEAGQGGRPLEELGDPAALSPEVVQAWESGNEDRLSPQTPPTGGQDRSGQAQAAGAGARTGGLAAGATGRVAARSPLPLSAEPGGFLLGVLGYTLALQFLQGGAGQVRAWLAAKFLNRPAGSSSSGAAAGAGGRVSGGGGAGGGGGGVGFG